MHIKAGVKQDLIQQVVRFPLQQVSNLGISGLQPVSYTHLTLPTSDLV